MTSLHALSPSRLALFRKLLAIDRRSPSHLRWKATRGGKARKGSSAGCLITPRGGTPFWQVSVSSKRYHAGRLILVLSGNPDPGKKFIVGFKDSDFLNYNPRNLYWLPITATAFSTSKIEAAKRVVHSGEKLLRRLQKDTQTEPRIISESERVERQFRRKALLEEIRNRYGETALTKPGSDLPKHSDERVFSAKQARDVHRQAEKILWDLWNEEKLKEDLRKPPTNSIRPEQLLKHQEKEDSCKRRLMSKRSANRHQHHTFKDVYKVGTRYQYCIQINGLKCMRGDYPSAQDAYDAMLKDMIRHINL